MDPIVVSVDERLDVPGACLPIQGHIELGSYKLGEHSFLLPQGIDYDIVLTNAGEGILASGLIRAHVQGMCDRCLGVAEFDVASELDEYFLFEAPVEEMRDEDDEVDFSLISAEKTIELSESIFAALLMETPFVVLCREDCKGICPDCGVNLNEHSCSCTQKRAVTAAKDHPFAKLANLKLDS